MDDTSAADSGTQSIEPVLIGSPIERIEGTSFPLKPPANNGNSVQYLTFQRRLHKKVVKILRSSAQEESARRDEILQQLFTELSYKVEPTVKEKLKGKSDLQVPVRYYLILSNYYVQFPDKANEIKNVDTLLWNTVNFQTIYSQLLFAELFKHGETEEHLVKRLNAFIKGTNKIFWLDLENSTRRFYPIYTYLEKLLLSEPEWNFTTLHAALELFNLVAKFYFYYDDVKTAGAFLEYTQIAFEKHANKLNTPPNHHKINTMNMFVNELVRHIRLIKNEDVLLHYLQQTRDIGTIPGQKTRVRLYTLLLDLSSPGSPLYPTRDVRHKAKETLDCIFPYGKIPRGVINLLFRLLHPYYATLSFISWSLTQFKRTFCSFFYVFTLLQIPFHWKTGNSESEERKKGHKMLPVPFVEKENQSLPNTEELVNHSDSSLSASSSLFMSSSSLSLRSSANQNTVSKAKQNAVDINYQNQYCSRWQQSLVNWILSKFRQ